MSICQGSFTPPGTSGSTTVNMPSPFKPIFFEFEIGPRTGATETWITRSNGWQDMDNNRKAAMSVYGDSQMHRTVETITNSITHYKNNAGVFTQIIAGSVSAVGIGTFTYTYSLGDTNYTVRYKAFSA